MVVWHYRTGEIYYILLAQEDSCKLTENSGTAETLSKSLLAWEFHGLLEENVNLSFLTISCLQDYQA